MAIKAPPRPPGLMSAMPKLIPGLTDPRDDQGLIIGRGAIETQPGTTPVPPAFTKARPYGDSTVEEISEVYEDDILREMKLLGLAVPEFLDRGWATKVAQAERLFDLLGRPARGQVITAHRELVKEISHTVHEGVSDHINEQLGVQISERDAQLVYCGCHYEVQADMANAVVRAFGATPVKGNLTIPITQRGGIGTWT